jgi:spermidine synthase
VPGSRRVREERLDPTPPRSAPSTSGPATRTLARQPGRHGELVLRERAGEYEIISNGMFLMDTRDGRSERLLVRSALEATRSRRRRRVVIAGLGVGSSLAEALACPEVSEILVIEYEPAVVAWNRATTGVRSGGHVDDARVRCEIADLVEWLQRPAGEMFDVLCLDVDNGPHWIVGPGNRWLYEDEGIAAMRDRLVEGGALSIWSAERVPVLEHRLQRGFGRVRRFEVPVARGEPDVVYLAHRQAMTEDVTGRRR